MVKVRCRHSASWILFGGDAEWCYVCGAIRRLKPIGPNSSVPATRWAVPTGDKDNNSTRVWQIESRCLAAMRKESK